MYVKKMKFAKSLVGSDVIHVPLSQIAEKAHNESDFTNLLPTSLRNKSQQIIVMCRSGVRSSRVANIMGQFGWEKVANLTGGILDYEKEIGLNR